MMRKESPTRTKNRKAIVEVAEKLFLENGIGHTTMMEIAEIAQVGRKTIYSYFESKELIAKYVFDQYMDKIYQTLKSNVDFSGCQNNYEKIRVLFKHFLKTLLSLKSETVFTVHYDYYTQCQSKATYMLDTIGDADFSDILTDILSVDDGSIDLNGNEPLKLIQFVGQSYMTFVSRMFFKGHRSTENKALDERHLHDFLDIIMRGLKK